MDCAQTKDLAARSLSGNASAADEAALREHAAACAACAEVLGRARKLWALMGRLPAVSSTASAPRVRAFRPARWIAAAAVVLAGLSAGWLLWPVAPVVPAPGPLVDRTPPPSEPSPTPEQVRAENALEKVVREEQARAPEAPAVEPPQPAPAVPPAPVVQAPAPKPEDPKPPAPLVKAPEPVPAPVPPAPARETLPVAARVERVEGEVFALVGGERTPAAAALRLTGGDGLLTVGKNSQAVLAYEDGTRLVLGADTTLSQVLDRAAEGRRIHVQGGLIAAQVARQPGGTSLAFVTPAAEARVAGTRLTLLVAPASTRLEVREGRVKLVRREDGAAVDVAADQYAVAAKGTSLAPRTLPGPKIALREDFERGRWSPLWGLQAEGLKAVVQNGVLLLSAPRSAAVEVTPSTLPNDPGALTKKALDQFNRVAALGSKKEWPRAAALESKGSFAFGAETPLRVRLNAWHSHADADRMVWLSLQTGPKGPGLLLERRGDVLRLWVEGAAAPLWQKEAPAVKEWETLELWLSKDHLVLRRNGLTAAVEANPLKGKAVQIALGTCAKAELAQDEETRVDDVDVSWMSKTEFDQISR